MNVLRRFFSVVTLAALFLALFPVPPVSAEEDGEYRLLALTFDDGPSKYTEGLLDGLKERGVNCTFFMVGYMAALYPELLQRMADEGHQLANHTYDHAILTTANAYKELEGCRQYLYAATEEDTYYVRPPYGTLRKGVPELLDAPAILWSVDSNDWRTKSADVVVKNVVDVVKDGDIILIHDSHEHSVEAALKIIDQLQAEGFQFVTVRELFRCRGVVPENGKKYFYARNNGINLRPQPSEYYDEKKLDQHWAYESIRYVLDQGYFTGTDTGKFLPNYRVTRAMFLTVLGRAAGAAVSPIGPMAYADVDPASYAAPYIRWMSERGVLPPAGEGAELKPDEPVTREEIAGLLYRLYSLTGWDMAVPEEYILPFTDAETIAPENLEGVRWCAYTGLFQGEEGEFRSGEATTRAQAAALLQRLDALLARLREEAERKAEQELAAEGQDTPAEDAEAEGTADGGDSDALSLSSVRWGLFHVPSLTPETTPGVDMLALFRALLVA